VLGSYAKKLGCELIVSSGFRSPEANKAAGGSSTSLHLQGLAIDFCFSDQWNIFEHVTPIYHLYREKLGGWAEATQMEVCRGIKDGAWVNHIHIAFKPAVPQICFTGTYEAAL
jgi:hypothetical protein